MEAIVYVRGDAKGNPGPAAVGMQVVDESGKVLHEAKESIGNGTSVYAEYFAVLRALQILVEMYGEGTQDAAFELRLDNEVVKKQLNAESQITEPGLVPMFIEIHNLRVANFPNLTIAHVPRAENNEADRLVNEALDESK